VTAIDEALVWRIQQHASAAAEHRRLAHEHDEKAARLLALLADLNGPPERLTDTLAARQAHAEARRKP
jgi:hypothetical protein